MVICTKTNMMAPPSRCATYLIESRQLIEARDSQTINLNAEHTRYPASRQIRPSVDLPKGCAHRPSDPARSRQAASRSA
jgi:hypothetical protein